ncbi:hypothetical protein M1L60_00590 [Actinoplanes sp. TRM 88003]|uniref:PH domain-containing protein n=1 Tax=Paractinoplanes aksuensis TaxID=2939490 RepID=A0ABT1DGA1_9ACTN|nr:hypothetical protein [Actinoplanes aksuensis]MCO8269080.1 hypothetical protein [Actinoplanes aksuensis]
MVERTYRFRGAWLVYPLLAVATIALPITALFIDAAAWWTETLFLLIAIPLAWWWASRQMIYRLDLTDTELRLRAPLARYRIRLQDLAEIGFPVDAGSAVIANQDGRVWYVLSGRDFEEFANAVGQAAPHVEVRVNDMPRRLADWLR